MPTSKSRRPDRSTARKPRLDVLPLRWRVESRVLREEPTWADRETGHLGRHHRILLDCRVVRDADRRPHDEATALHGLRVGVGGQPLPRRALIWIITSGV